MRLIDLASSLRHGSGQEDFEAHHPDGVLLRRNEALSDQDREFRTTVARTMGANSPPIGTEIGPDLEVMILKKRPGGIFPDRIGVGRTRAADVFLPDPTVSKYHAYFTRDSETAKHYLVDANASNGTFAGGVRLAPGEKIALADAMLVRFGRIVVRFHTAEGVYRILEALGAGTAKAVAVRDK